MEERRPAREIGNILRMVGIDDPGSVPRELERAGWLCVAFVNTAAPRREGRAGLRALRAEPFADYASALEWAQRMGIAGAADAERLGRLAAEEPQRAGAAAARARQLRDALLQALTRLATGQRPTPESLAILNAHLETALAARRVVPGGDGFRWDWGGDELAPERILWPIALSAAELLISDRVGRLRQCATRGCGQLFVYRSKKRRWCDMKTCGTWHLNRARRRR